MEYRKLGHSGLKVSTLCLGTMTFGEADENSFMHGVGASEATSFAIMDKALDAGINFFDTADVYGNDGLTERVIGKWFTQAKRRDEVVLATKFRFRMGEGPNNTGASRRRIVKTVEDSLRRLATDRIDLYQIHMQDIDTPEQETLRALDDLVRAGKVLYIGASNYAAYRLMESVMTSERLGLERFIALQAQYSLVTRDIEREHVPLCRSHELGIIPWSPLAGGFLTGKYEQVGGPPAGSRLDKWKQRYEGFNTPRNWAILDAVKAIAAAHESTAAAVSLAWLLKKPAVTSVIFGARSVAQLDDNLKAAQLELSDADMQRLDEASAFELGYPYSMIKGIQASW
ncbi:aldo/keto reductase [Enhygromyxa salina]|uniref:L-glyceraldehyde 3-phosphate reductase n=1 Tax=Enhygromyxa salina TaxID=215803 RepID=A0A2S9YU60_9BACT|nr:aldo/keto reductase [Enhygromyxa salina]PRQ08628.1 L-glyceraldehyde 3-phosphate reductase [Enhygromyxa salina]